jgi:anti-sigma factor RsiW
MKRLVALMMRLMKKRTCEDVVSVLQDYFDGTLDPKLAAIIERHFEGCPDCSAFARTYQEVIKLAGGDLVR